MKEQSVRQDIRKRNKGNSFYDVMEPRSYKDKRKYQIVAGLKKAVFTMGGK